MDAASFWSVQPISDGSLVLTCTASLWLQPCSDLYSLPLVRSSPQLRQTLLLSLGTVVHKLIKADDIIPMIERELQMILKEVSEELLKLYQEVSFTASNINCSTTVV